MNREIFDKILANLYKSDDGKESWPLEGLKKVFSTMISENVIGFMDGPCKIKLNQEKNMADDQTFVEDTKIDSLEETSFVYIIYLKRCLRTGHNFLCR